MSQDILPVTKETSVLYEQGLFSLANGIFLSLLIIIATAVGTRDLLITLTIVVLQLMLVYVATFKLRLQKTMDNHEIIKLAKICAVNLQRNGLKQGQTVLVTLSTQNPFLLPVVKALVDYIGAIPILISDSSILVKIPKDFNAVVLDTSKLIEVAALKLNRDESGIECKYFSVSTTKSFWAPHAQPLFYDSGATWTGGNTMSTSPDSPLLINYTHQEGIDTRPIIITRKVYEHNRKIFSSFYSGGSILNLDSPYWSLLLFEAKHIHVSYDRVGVLNHDHLIVNGKGFKYYMDHRVDIKAKKLVVINPESKIFNVKEKEVIYILSGSECPIIATSKHSADKEYGFDFGQPVNGVSINLAPLYSSNASSVGELLETNRIGEIIVDGEGVSPGVALLEDGYVASFNTELYQYTGLLAIQYSDSSFCFSGYKHESVCLNLQELKDDHVLSCGNANAAYVPVWLLEYNVYRLTGNLVGVKVSVTQSKIIVHVSLRRDQLVPLREYFKNAKLFKGLPIEIQD
ncbi:hypothetical protein MP638_000149 [Amoeboaphelidium occidentale]|nr:hypothetical protein MP638_000149 [Amoeboaphelidium occidentale]